MNSNAILVVNAGSSSMKCSLFASRENATLERVYQIDITGIGTHASFLAKDVTGTHLIKEYLGTTTHENAFAVLLDWIAQREEITLVAAGHRIVHGGITFTAPVLTNDDIIHELEQLIPLAPLHQAHNIAPIKALHHIKPDLPQVACFDTAFHATQPAIARTFALPRSLTEQGIRGYGFHGLSYEYIAQTLPKVAGYLPNRMIVAHLGNGASLAALKAGESIATTMSFTALDGLPMGTRCGAIDPGVLLHLLNEGMDLKTLSDLLYHQSGLRGVSGISNDMQTLLNSPSQHAAEAIELWVYRIGREIGSLAAALGGLDALVFTAGIGERAAPIRAKVCETATWLGVQIEESANEQHGPKISTQNSQVSVWVMPTDEEKMIAQHTDSLLKSMKQ
ncbi:MAG TPA: acetate kinase [Gammaproteobacteria bacterium]|nr:acetate kinase [Gammaproteobacteria bacterium]